MSKRNSEEVVNKEEQGQAKKQRLEEAATAEIVAVTGASGYAAGPIVEELTRRGYKVRGTVRSLANQEKVQHLKDRFPEIELFEADLNVDGSFDTCFTGCTYVMHVASPFQLNVENPERDLIQPAVNGTKNVMQSALRCGVKRVVVTSSCAAVTPQTAMDDPSSIPADKAWTEDDWNDSSTLEKGPYRMSKFQAERAAWDFVQANPQLELAVVCPSFILGPPCSNRIDSVSVKLIVDMLNGVYAKDGIPPSAFGINDVRDLAYAHVEAMSRPEAAGKRFIVSSELGVTKLEYANMLREQERFAKYPLPTKLTTEDFYRVRVSNARCKDILGVNLRDVRETLCDMADDVIRRGLVNPPPSS